MSKIPVETWYTIAQYIPAQPIIFLRLASVSIGLYQVFMSDKVWTKVDVYGVKKHISKHYTASIYGSTPAELDFKRKLFEDGVDEDSQPRKRQRLPWDSSTHGRIELGTRTWFEKNLYDSYTMRTRSGRFGYHRFSHLITDECLGEKVVAETGRLDAICHGLRQKKTLIKAAVSRRGKRLGDISPDKKDRDIVLAAVYNDGLALEYASVADRQDPDIVLAAVYQNGLAIQHAPKFLQLNVPKSREILQTAIRNNLDSFQLMPPETQQDSGIFLLAFTIGQKAFGIRCSMCSFWIKGGRLSKKKLN